MTDQQHVARRALIQKLESLQRAGVAQLGRPRATVAETGSPKENPPSADTGSPPQPAGITETLPASSPESRSLFEEPLMAGSPPTPEQCQRQLTVLHHEVSGCTRCSELVANRSQTVFGVGNPAARLCFFGEAPGADEDKQGEPFVGRAGQLLDKIIEACTLKREDVYIMNVVKCRPPGNRNPTPSEAENCQPFFERQFEIIRPEFICCLGAVAATTLLGTTQSIGRLRGRFHEWRGIKVLATYHPAYLLRNPAAKNEVWKDMQILMAQMGVELPGQGK